ncbi:MAG: Gfo/Idh/MocA family oxidoreductase [Bacteroidales bacterium]|nr:Gfo/Idh/MocA family oxidoreductase [Bacteroidales bacterium]
MPLKVGIVGVGHFGKLHLKALKNIKTIELVGFYDIDPIVQKEVAEVFNVKSFNSYKELIKNCDVIDIVTPTVTHFECAYEAIKAQKHIFIEKPVTHTVKKAEQLIKLADEAGIKAQVGHIERFNPAYLSIENYINEPKFIEANRLQPFTNRSLDISVILNLMIHDIDIILNIVNSKISKIRASGAKVATNFIDVANVRIEFENGCIAHLSTSRIATSNLRIFKIFQKNSCITIDFLNKKSEIISAKTIEDNDKISTFIESFYPEIINFNAIEVELNSFFEAIINNTTPKITLEHGLNALKIAMDINDIILKNFC